MDQLVGFYRVIRFVRTMFMYIGSVDIISQVQKRSSDFGLDAVT